MIFTIPNDTHAATVQTLLEEMGASCQPVFLGDFPKEATLTFRNDTGINLVMGDSHEDRGKELLEPVNTVWYRRLAPGKDDPSIHPDDRKSAAQECQHFIANFLALRTRGSVWVNDLSAARAANNKLLQLVVAQECGLVVPKTCASNDPRQIKEFLSSHAKAIYKPFTSHMWEDGDLSHVTYTRLVSGDDLPSDRAVTASPGIFQEWIPKSYEVRVTFMGAHHVSAKLLTAEQEDWRISIGGDLRAELFKLPDLVAESCRSLMNRLGIIFGCFDFVVRPDGSWVFLEVNEMGQFLWVERLLEDAYLLDAFCQFLLEPSADFNYTRKSSSRKLREITKTPRFRELIQNSANHCEVVLT